MCYPLREEFHLDGTFRLATVVLFRDFAILWAGDS